MKSSVGNLVLCLDVGGRGEGVWRLRLKGKDLGREVGFHLY